MSGRNQLLGARLAARLLGPGRPRDVEPAECAAADPLDLPRTAHEIAVPRHFRPTLGCHQVPPSRIASTLTSALPRTSVDIVHACSASAAVRWNVSASMPGTRPRTE